MINVERLPAEIRQSNRAVLWNSEERNGKPTKVPYVPSRPAMRAAVDDPTTWDTFAAAVAAVEDGKADGVGIVLGEDFVIGVDIDGCRNPETGAIDPEALDIIQALDSYTEISPSRCGVHVLMRGTLPPGRRRKGQIEMYCSGRYFTVTGQHVAGTTTTIEERTVALGDVHCRIFGNGNGASPRRARHPSASVLDLDDTALLERARAARNGAKFSTLETGDWSAYGSQSEADQAFCNLLAFVTDKDSARMDRLFRQSGLMRGKWDERRGTATYGDLTIATAIAGSRQTYSGSTYPTESRQVRRARERRGTKASGARDGDGAIPLGERDHDTGRLVLSPRRTLPTAEAYVRAFHQHPDGRLLHGYAGLLLEWRENRYCEIEDQAINCRLQEWLHQALRYIVVDRRTGAMALTDFESNPSTVKQALDSIRTYVHLPATIVSPSWLGHRTHPPALEILPCRSMNVHIPTGEVLPATPTLFTTSALDFEYDPQASTAEQWLAFLAQLLEHDSDSISLLQEWFGYCLIADTSQHKMLLLVGPRRSGKGTIGRVLTRLVGVANVGGPTTSSLAGNFGLQPLIGKSLAIVSDARFTGEHVASVVERLLCISGEDTLTIERKFLGAVTMKLPTRFMFLTNELPRLNDASTALAGRFLVLRLTRSFYDEEDPTLTDRLSTELPGILLWAIEGWTRLQERGHFVQPASAEDAIQDLEDLASPVRPFVRECCTTLAELRVPIDTLYAAWEMYCKQNGRKVGTKQMFGRDLASVVPRVKRRRGTDFVPFYEGISLTSETTEALDRFQKTRVRAQEADVD